MDEDGDFLGIANLGDAIDNTVDQVDDFLAGILYASVYEGEK